jgi:putative ABC transport system substrate-binding protein
LASVRRGRDRAHARRPTDAPGGRPIPTVFIGIADPVGSGVVPSLARPGGNVTGFTAFEYDIGGKWLSLLKQFAPAIARVALLYNSNTAPWADNFWRSFQATAPSFGVTPAQMNVRDAAAIEHAIDALAREPNGALLGVPAFARPKVSQAEPSPSEGSDALRVPETPP